jgi:hypothetical protein
MTAHCWACDVGVTAVGAANGDPIGACWDCHVFGCLGHGARDSGSGKWLCFPSVATAAAASAGLAGTTSSVKFDSISDLEDRFSVLVNAAGQRWTPANAEASARDRLHPVRDATFDYPLLAAAASIGEFLLPRHDKLVAERSFPDIAVLPRSLVILLEGRRW